VRCSGARIAHSSQPHAAVSHAAVDLVVLTDYLVADPRMLRDLHSPGRSAPSGSSARRNRSGGPSGHPGRDQLPRQSLRGTTEPHQEGQHTISGSNALMRRQAARPPRGT